MNTYISSLHFKLYITGYLENKTYQNGFITCKAQLLWHNFFTNHFFTKITIFEVSSCSRVYNLLKQSWNNTCYFKDLFSKLVSFWWLFRHKVTCDLHITNNCFKTQVKLSHMHTYRVIKSLRDTVHYLTPSHLICNTKLDCQFQL